MALTAAGRKAWLAVHITASVGWIGAVAAFIVLDATTVTSDDGATLRAAYIAMGLMTTWAIVPLALAASFTGLVVSLGTKWGLFRHWWVIITLALTILATLVLVQQIPLIAYRADVASNPGSSDADVRALGNLLLHSVGGTVVLLVVLWLNVYKPRGVTRYGWRKQQEQPPSEGEARP